MVHRVQRALDRFLVYPVRNLAGSEIFTLFACSMIYANLDTFTRDTAARIPFQLAMAFLWALAIIIQIRAMAYGNRRACAEMNKMIEERMAMLEQLKAKHAAHMAELDEYRQITLDNLRKQREGG